MPTLTQFKAPFGVQHYYDQQQKKYVLHYSTFSREHWFILMFTVLWTAGFLVFLQNMLYEMVVEGDYDQGLKYIFFFSHGLPAVFLCQFSFKLIFGRVTLIIDREQLIIKERFSKEVRKDFLIQQLTTLYLEDDPTSSIVLQTAEETFELGEELSDKKCAFVVELLSSILTKIKEDPHFLGRDYSQHLVD